MKFTLSIIFIFLLTSCASSSHESTSLKKNLDKYIDQLETKN